MRLPGTSGSLLRSRPLLKSTFQCCSLSLAALGTDSRDSALTCYPRVRFQGKTFSRSAQRVRCSLAVSEQRECPTAEIREQRSHEAKVSDRTEIIQSTPRICKLQVLIGRAGCSCTSSAFLPRHSLVSFVDPRKMNSLLKLRPNTVPAYQRLFQVRAPRPWPCSFRATQPTARRRLANHCVNRLRTGRPTPRRALTTWLLERHTPSPAPHSSTASRDSSTSMRTLTRSEDALLSNGALVASSSEA